MIDALSYIGFTSPAADEWRRFGPDLLGFQLVGPDPAIPSSDGAVRLRMDDAAYRIAIHPGDTDGLAYFGWSVAGAAELAAATARLRDHGLVVEAGSAELAAERAVLELAWFTDPFGFRHELSYGQQAGREPFRPGRPISGFVTGSGGLGHVVLFVPDLERADDFYRSVLGFRLSDDIEVQGMTLRFLHCNGRHHTLALVPVPGMVGVHHLMVEVADVDDVGTALDVCRKREVPIAMGMGKHPNDLMTSFYARTPSGFELEYGYGGAIVDDATWITTTYDATSLWGHRPGDGPPPGPPVIIRPFEEASA